ncbi:Peptidyl-prolyl cis-trans isomerase cyp8, partial [Cladochytrium tenue]
NIVPWIKKHGTNPVTGEPLAAADLITLHFHKNATGEFHDPITFKVFTENTHIVAVSTTGHVYAYETIEELNIKPKNWHDLMTDEPFKRKDLITIQDPHNLTSRDINQFHYRKNEIDVPEPAGGAAATTTAAAAGINARGTTARVLAAMAPKPLNQSSTDAAGDSAAAGGSVTPSYVAPRKRAYNQAHYSDNSAAAAFTSMGAVAVTRNAAAVISDDEYLVAKVKGSGYAQIKTSLGDLNVELFCGDAPRTCLNFIMLAKK